MVNVSPALSFRILLNDNRNVHKLYWTSPLWGGNLPQPVEEGKQQVSSTMSNGRINKTSSQQICFIDRPVHKVHTLVYLSYLCQFVDFLF